MKPRLPASRDIRRALESLLFHVVLLAGLTAPWWILHSGLARGFAELVEFLVTVRHYR